MKTINLDLTNLKDYLEILTNVKTPILTTIQKILEEQKPFNDSFLAERKELLGEFAILNEKGGFLGKKKKDSEERILNPPTFYDIEFNNEEEFWKLFNELNSKEVEVEFTKIDTSKTFFDSRCNKEKTIGEFLDEEIGMLEIKKQDGNVIFGVSLLKILKHFNII